MRRDSAGRRARINSIEQRGSGPRRPSPKGNCRLPIYGPLRRRTRREKPRNRCRRQRSSGCLQDRCYGAGTPRSPLYCLRLVKARRRPSIVRGPVDSPPCMRQRPLTGPFLFLFHTAGARQGVPFLVLAPHLGRSCFGVTVCVCASSSAMDLPSIAWTRRSTSESKLPIDKRYS